MTTPTGPCAEPRWLDPAELVAWRRFSGMLVVLLSALDGQLQRDADLSFFGYLVLAGLSESPDRTMRMGDLAVLASGSQSRLSHAVSTLERRGWVVRRPDPANRRVTLATLTDAGWEKVVATAPGHVAAVRALVVDRLSPGEFAELGRLASGITGVPANC